MTATRGTTRAPLALVLTLLLAAALALLPLAPAAMSLGMSGGISETMTVPVSGGATSLGDVAQSAPDALAAPCHGDDAGGDCMDTVRHCAACHVVVFAAQLAVARAPELPMRATGRDRPVRALPQPGVPPGPPRLA